MYRFCYVALFSVRHCLNGFAQKPSHRVNKWLGLKLPSGRKVIGCLMLLGLLRNSVISSCFHFLQVSLMRALNTENQQNNSDFSFSTLMPQIPATLQCPAHLDACLFATMERTTEYLFASKVCSTVFAHKL